MNYSTQRVLLTSLNIIDAWDRKQTHNADILLVRQP